MSGYVNMVVIPVPLDGLNAYRELATNAGKVWIEHGSLEYFEGVGDDVADDGGPMRTIPELSDVSQDESIIVAFIEFESQDHRNEMTAAVMKDPVYREHFNGEMLFNQERMAMGGFRSIVSYEN